MILASQPGFYSFIQDKDGLRFTDMPERCPCFLETSDITGFSQAILGQTAIAVIFMPTEKAQVTDISQNLDRFRL
jgi:hypothetical protein